MKRDQDLIELARRAVRVQKAKEAGNPDEERVAGAELLEIYRKILARFEELETKKRLLEREVEALRQRHLDYSPVS